MKQMVYVVIDNDGVTGVWNEYKDAENHVSEDGVIIPVIVDQYGHRDGCETPSEVVTAMEKELQNMYSALSKFVDDDDEDDDYDDDDDDEYDDDDDDEDEDDDYDDDEDEEYDDDDDDDEDEEDDDGFDLNEAALGLLHLFLNE